jgi:hypothetical protein
MWGRPAPTKTQACGAFALGVLVTVASDMRLLEKTVLWVVLGIVLGATLANLALVAYGVSTAHRFTRTMHTRGPALKALLQPVIAGLTSGLRQAAQSPGGGRAQAVAVPSSTTGPPATSAGAGMAFALPHYRDTADAGDGTHPEPPWFDGAPVGTGPLPPLAFLCGDSPLPPPRT